MRFASISMEKFVLVYEQYFKMNKTHKLRFGWSRFMQEMIEMKIQ